MHRLELWTTYLRQVTAMTSRRPEVGPGVELRPRKPERLVGRDWFTFGGEGLDATAYEL